MLDFVVPPLGADGNSGTIAAFHYAGEICHCGDDAILQRNGKALPQPIRRLPSKHGWLLHTLLIHADLIHVNRVAIFSRGLNPIKNKCAEQKEDETNEEQQNHHPLLIRWRRHRGIAHYSLLNGPHS